MPRGGIQRLARRAVDDFPPAGNVVAVVDLHQLAADARHQGDGQRTVRSGIERGHNVALLRFIGVRLGPGVVLAGGVVGGVDLGAGVLQLLREFGAVAVADGIRAPALRAGQGFGYCGSISVGNRLHDLWYSFLVFLRPLVRLSLSGLQGDPAMCVAKIPASVLCCFYGKAVLAVCCPLIRNQQTIFLPAKFLKCNRFIFPALRAGR